MSLMHILQPHMRQLMLAHHGNLPLGAYSHVIP